MKCKIALALSSVLLLMLVPSALVQASPSIQAWTNKPSYQPGDKGTLHIAITNEKDTAITLYNVTVVFPWYRSTINEGNVTKDINEALKAGETYQTDVEFSVPNDGRAQWGGTAAITAMMDSSPYTLSASASIPVALPVNTPAANTLIIALIAIVLVCTGGIVAMIYWTAKNIRKP